MISLKTSVIVAFLFASIANADNYSATIQTADWEVKQENSYCQLKQKIPLYGIADFTHQSGDLLRFSIKEERFKPNVIKASLSVDTPPWLHNSLEKKDYSVFLDQSIDIQNMPRLSVYGDTAEVMLDALSDGLSPKFSYVRASAFGGSTEIQVAISSANFSKSYRQFRACRKNFLPYGLKEILEKTLFFKPRSQSLNAAALTQLRDVAKYIKQVKGARVSIVSNTASLGSRDKKWFSNRAKVIVAKLNKLGVPKAKAKINNGAYEISKNHKIIQLSVFGPDALTAIYYRKGNIKLTQTEKQRLKLLVRYTKAFMPNTGLVINSHTDSKGKRAKNLAVSQKRGAEIKRYLISQRMEAAKVKIKAYGESRPVKSNRFPRGRSQNRRVIIDFVV